MKKKTNLMYTTVASDLGLEGMSYFYLYNSKYEIEV